MEHVLFVKIIEENRHGSGINGNVKPDRTETDVTFYDDEFDIYPVTIFVGIYFSPQKNMTVHETKNSAVFYLQMNIQ